MNRRERLREATMTEIRQLAREQLAKGGPGAISLRAIARDMGMTAAAIYRYYDSLEALTDDLCADRYAALTKEVVAAQQDQTNPVERLRQACRAFRRWALAHPQEFALICGAPATNPDGESTATPKMAAGVEFTLAFVEPFAAVWRSRPGPPAPLVPGVIASMNGPVVDVVRQALPLEGIVAFVIGWARLSGSITMEIFGHLHWAVADAEALVEQNLDDMLRQLSGPPA
jgi:AcrR family transcriptional regulator